MEGTAVVAPALTARPRTDRTRHSTRASSIWVGAASLPMKAIRCFRPWAARQAIHTGEAVFMTARVGTPLKPTRIYTQPLRGDDDTTIVGVVQIAAPLDDEVREVNLLTRKLLTLPADLALNRRTRSGVSDRSRAPARARRDSRGPAASRRRNTCRRGWTSRATTNFRSSRRPSTAWSSDWKKRSVGWKGHTSSTRRFVADASHELRTRRSRSSKPTPAWRCWTRTWTPPTARGPGRGRSRRRPNEPHRSGPFLAGALGQRATTDELGPSRSDGFAASGRRRKPLPGQRDASA